MSRSSESEPKRSDVPEALPGEVQFRGKYLTVTTEKKGEITYERVKVRDGVSVIVVTGDNKVRLLREGDWDSGDVRVKPVSGYIRADEPKKSCAERELNEEMGVMADSWEEFLVSSSENPTVKHTQTFYVVRGMQPGQAQPKANEQIFGTVDLTPEEVLKLAFEGKFGSRETAFVLVRLALQLLGRN